MNPADRQYSLSLDDVREPCAQETCEMCGANKCECGEETDVALHRAMERVYRLCEWAVWCGMSSKALGSTMRVIAAKTINPGASVQQIAAVVGMTKPGVYVAMRRAEKCLPHVYKALWNTGDHKGDA